ncbi:MAG: ArgR family transcriptional regulator [Spirochaetales bacterium]|nr:ArgR family transcriptional regulator [Spirochaetales bacterium]
MKDRAARHRAISRQIRNSRVSSQEDLLAHLHKEGFDVTQATLSRDLKSLRVGKIYDDVSGYYYAIPGEEQIKESMKQYTQDIIRGWLSIQFSGNLGVVKTLAGHADSVALALDNLDLPGVLGTVAGDDTVILVLEEKASGEKLVEELGNKVPEIGETL